MQFDKVEIVLHLNMQRAAGSRASGPGSTKTQLKFNQLEEKKDVRVAAEPLPREVSSLLKQHRPAVLFEQLQDQVQGVKALLSVAAMLTAI